MSFLFGSGGNAHDNIQQIQHKFLQRKRGIASRQSEIDGICLTLRSFQEALKESPNNHALRQKYKSLYDRHQKLRREINVLERRNDELRKVAKVHNNAVRVREKGKLVDSVSKLNNARDATIMARKVTTQTTQLSMANERINQASETVDEAFDEMLDDIDEHQAEREHNRAERELARSISSDQYCDVNNITYVPTLADILSQHAEEQHIAKLEQSLPTICTLSEGKHNLKGQHDFTA